MVWLDDSTHLYHGAWSCQSCHAEVNLVLVSMGDVTSMMSCTVALFLVLGAREDKAALKGPESIQQQGMKKLWGAYPNISFVAYPDEVVQEWLRKIFLLSLIRQVVPFTMFVSG